MAHSYNIQISDAIETLNIGYYPHGLVRLKESSESVVVDTTPRQSTININNVESFSITNSIGTDDLSFDTSNALSVTLGTILTTPLLQELDAYKYSLDGFTISNANTFTTGDIVYFEFSNGANPYNSIIKKADVQHVSKGAYMSLMIFLSYNNGLLRVMHKGYFDYESTDTTNINGWSVGRTIYLDHVNKINTIPTANPGHWVRSLGFCVPNNLGKKRIWFEPDRTYLKLA